MPVEPSWPWGKLERDATERVAAWQSLAEHSHDVAAIFSALLRLPGIARRLALLSNRSALDSITAARLSYLVYLHDCGKVNVGFQARANPKFPTVGHIAPLAAVCGVRADRAVSERALEALGAHRLERWGDGIISLFDVILSHHGRPWPRDGDGQAFAKHWKAAGAYDPIVALDRLRADADDLFPSAFSDAGESLPSAPAFCHAIAGLVQLADWIGSSEWKRARGHESAEAWSKRVLLEIGLDPSACRARVPSSVTFEAVFGRSPYPHQTECGEGSARLLILEAETGSGKTEAALWRFLQLFRQGDVDGLYFALPTRTAAAQLHARVEGAIESVWPTGAPFTVMAVPGYLDAGELGALPSALDPFDGPEDDLRSNHYWAADHPKRFFSAMVGVGTIDQALLAALRVKHAHLRGSCLMRHLLVVDEVHASDSYMQRLLEQLLRDHLAAGGFAMLLSATLGAQTRRSLMEAAMGGRPRDLEAMPLSDAMRIPYPLISAGMHKAVQSPVASSGKGKVVRMQSEPLLDDPLGIAELAAAAANEGAKVLVVRNTVGGAVAVQRILERLMPPESSILFRVNGQTTLHHSRFAREDRLLLDRAVEHVVGRTRPEGGMVIIGTQTLEQSLDIDVDLLITDLCPIDVLLQRIGRLHRHLTDVGGAKRSRPAGFDEPVARVLVPGSGLADFLPSRRTGGLERHGLGHSIEPSTGAILGIYPDLCVLEATKRLVEQQPQWRIPTMNRVLVESGIHSEALDNVIATMPEEAREAWQKNRQRVIGDELAQMGTASGNVLRRDRDFMDQALSDAERISTRLGTDDRLVALPPGTVGPFGQRITQIRVPGWMLRGEPIDAEATIANFENRTDFQITIGRRHFTYGALGLHVTPVIT